MNIIKIEQNSNGSHANQFGANVCPSGYAIIPNDMAIPSSFPFVDIEVEGNKVVSMVEREVPPIESMPYVPTTEDRVAELEKENKLLKAQAKMADEQMSFLEDCLLEMADIVYA